MSAGLERIINAPFQKGTKTMAAKKKTTKKTVRAVKEVEEERASSKAMREGAKRQARSKAGKLTAQQKLDLFRAFEKADTAYQKARETTAEALRYRSAAIQAIAESCGKGPFQYKGRELKIGVRTPENGETTYFVRHEKKAVEVIG